MALNGSSIFCNWTDERYFEVESLKLVTESKLPNTKQSIFKQSFDVNSFVINDLLPDSEYEIQGLSGKKYTTNRELVRTHCAPPDNPVILSLFNYKVLNRSSALVYLQLQVEQHKYN